MNKLVKKVGIWIRVSTDDQARGESPEHHKMRAQKYAELKKWKIVETYDLSGVSGKSVINHPEAKRMLADIESGHITGLIFSKLARLARNTRELLDFCDIFNHYNADLISLSQDIDTTSPAGRMFYTVISANAQFERETIAERVAASVPIRAELGKPLGGQAPYGYQWKEKKLIINEEEAPVRKLMFELYLTEKRKGRVARVLNDRGYRTRKGGKWSDTSIDRLLTDPIAKGLRRANYTRSEGKNKRWIIKPKEEWVFQKVTPIVTEELWNQVNSLIKSQRIHRPRRKANKLFGGVTFCHCETKMYLLSNTPKYTCTKCRNKIHKDDLEGIFHEQLNNVLFDEHFAHNLVSENQKEIEEKSYLMHQLTVKAKDLKEQLNQLLELQRLGELPTKGFKDHYNPIFEQLEQTQNRIPELEEEISFLKGQTMNAEQSVQEAKDIHSQWKFLSNEDKKAIIEIMVEKIIVYKDTIEFKMMGLPKKSEPDPSSGNENNTSHNTNTTLQSFTDPNNPPPFKTLQKSNATVCLRWSFTTYRIKVQKAIQVPNNH